jgi:tetratricopeptide (TPR) repeat protein
MATRAKRRQAAQAQPARAAPVPPAVVAPAPSRLGHLQEALPVLVVVLAALLALRRLEDFDTWWHLAVGRWIARNWAMPHTDPLSYTMGDEQWINMSWLFDLFIYLVHRLGGVNALQVSAVVAFGTATALMVTGLRRTVGAVLAAALGLWVVIMMQERFAVRPEMLSYVLLLGMQWLLATARRHDGRFLWLLPVAMVVWSNVHSLSVIGSVLIGCHLAGALAARLPGLPRSWRLASEWSPTGVRRLWCWGLLGLLATAVTPYGLTGLLFPIKLVAFVDRSNPTYAVIGELKPPFSGFYPTVAIRAYQPFFIISIAIVALAMVTTAVRRGAGARPAAGPSGINVADLALFAGLAMLSLQARRNVGLFAIGAAPFVGECLALSAAALPAGFAAARRAGAAVLGFALAAGLIALSVFTVTNALYQWSEEVREFGFGPQPVATPARAAEFAKAVGCPPRLFNDVAAGGYLAWAAPVEGGVYIDGRLGPSDGRFFSEYSALLRDPEAWQADADRQNFQTVILFHRWPNRFALIQALANDDRWEAIYYDDVAVVFVRRTGNEELIEKAASLFEVERQITRERLLGAPAREWQHPIDQATAATTYGQVLRLLGEYEEAFVFLVRATELGLPPSIDLGVRMALTAYYANKGDMATAYRQLQHAEADAPGSPEVARLRAQLNDLNQPR